MKVLIITQQEYPHAGGMSTHIGYLCQGLGASGIPYSVVSGEPGGLWMKVKCQLKAMADADRYACCLFEERLSRLSERIAERTRLFGASILHCHDVFAVRAALLASMGSPKPLVLTVHGPMLYEARQSYASRPLFEARVLESERVAYSQADQVIAVDTGQADILENDYGMDRGNITVIPNALDIQEVRTRTAGETALAPAGPFFLAPRRLVPKTGVRYAIEALSKIEDKEISLLIAGDGPLRKSLASLARQIGVQGRVRFLGSLSRESLLPLFSRAIAVLVPSVPASGVIEATSLAVLEAMASGTVAIASRIGGLAELIEDGQTGLLVEPADADNLAKAMLSIYRDPALRKRIIAEAAERLEKRYSLLSWMARILSVYRSVSVPASGQLQ